MKPDKLVWSISFGGAMQFGTSIPKKGIWPVICAILFSVCCSSCWFGPSERILTPKEEMQLQRQEESTYSLPPEQRGIAQQQVECDRENLKRKDWHARDYLLDALSDEKSSCDSFYEKATQSKEPNVLKDNRPEIDILIYKNLQDALEKSKK